MKRLAWPDAAKGLAMFLVVLAHAAIWFDQNIDPTTANAWLFFDSLFGPLRMPLFFFISGYFSVRTLGRSLSASRARTIGMWWVYTIWTLLFLVRLFIPAARGASSPPTIGELALSVILPTPFWYLWALPVYFLITKAATAILRGKVVWATVPFLALAGASPWIDDFARTVLQEPLDPLKLGPVAANLVWFFVGAIAPKTWDNCMLNASFLKLWSSTLLYIVLVLAATEFGLEEHARFTLAPFALFVSSQALALLNLDGWVGRALQWVGRGTLQIYVLHMFAISLVSLVATHVDTVNKALAAHSALAGAMVPLLLALLLTPFCRQLGTFALRFPAARWLFQAPHWLIGRPQTAKTSARSPMADAPTP